MSNLVVLSDCRYTGDYDITCVNLEIVSNLRVLVPSVYRYEINYDNYDRTRKESTPNFVEQFLVCALRD